MKESKAGGVHYDALFYSVEEQTMERICLALEKARDNAIECFNAHVTSIIGEMTENEKHISRLLLVDVKEAADLIKLLKKFRD